MAINDLLAVVSSAEKDDAVLRAADALQRQFGAVGTALVVGVSPVMPQFAEGWMIDINWNQVLDDATARVKEERTKVAARLATMATPLEIVTEMFDGDTAEPGVAVHARHHDLTVITMPIAHANKSLHNRMYEGALFGSGRPVLVMPPEWRGSTFEKPVMLAWNARKEAARAIADAAPFLERASSIVIAMVNAEPSMWGHGETPGADLAAHLARKGFKAEVRNIAGAGRSDAQALADEARAIDAGLVVMGGFGRSRIGETVFGGVTKDLLTSAHVPLLMAH